MDSEMPPLVYDADRSQFDVETADPDQSPEIYNVSATTQVIAVPVYGIDKAISYLNDSIDDYIQDNQPEDAKRCLFKLQQWENVKSTFQTEVLPADALNSEQPAYVPNEEDSVDAVLIPRVWLEHKIEREQEDRNRYVRKSNMEKANYYRARRKVYETFILERNAEFTVQTEMLNVGVVEKIEELE